MRECRQNEDREDRVAPEERSAAERRAAGRRADENGVEGDAQEREADDGVEEAAARVEARAPAFRTERRVAVEARVRAVERDAARVDAEGAGGGEASPLGHGCSHCYAMPITTR